MLEVMLILFKRKGIANESNLECKKIVVLIFCNKKFCFFKVYKNKLKCDFDVNVFYSVSEGF